MTSFQIVQTVVCALAGLLDDGHSFDKVVVLLNLDFEIAEIVLQVLNLSGVGFQLVDFVSGELLGAGV